MKIDKKIFREFTDYTTAHDWGLKNYAEWISRLSRESPQQSEITSNLVSSYINAEHDWGIADVLFGYTGSKNMIYNQILNDETNFDEGEILQFSKEIELIDSELRKFALPENIVVSRYTHKFAVDQLFKNQKVKVGETLQYKGFVSTTLVEDKLREFAKNHKYNCVLRIYLRKGIMGAYIWFEDGLNEAEFLLPKNCTLKLLKKRFFYKGLFWLYECVLVSQ
ncbi:ADP-ribosyltransferase [Anaerosporobacter sp.]|uniref:ADP-ribosyltransferase n=1 Tax=Anaerosporobacter sp. TaxID=1872529 RepID=UPI00286F5554|nr:ADP-ribosyltransferase [Anaerosporobacter sp.]